MKRVIYILLVLPLILFSCEKTPEASFSTDNAEPEVGQVVFFNNSSHNGDTYEWDFGDGYISEERNPSHIFNSTGSFEVTLTVFGKSDLSDEASLTINVLIPTLLEIEVREYFSEDLIPDASIILYQSLPDWDAQTNSVLEGFTDADGIVVFSNLDPFVFYVDVWEATHDNYALRNEDVGFIRTDEILPNKINRFIAWVDIVDHSSGVARGTREMVVKKIGRNAGEKRQPSVESGTENWQELYNRIRKK